MATALGSQCQAVFFSKWGEGRRRREASPIASQADMCSSCWAVTRTHHTHRPCSHPLMHRLKIASSSSPPPPFPRSASSIPHSPPLTCQFLSRLPLANTVINLCLSASLAESMGCLQSRCWYWLRCTRPGPPDRSVTPAAPDVAITTGLLCVKTLRTAATPPSRFRTYPQETVNRGSQRISRP